MQYIYLFPVHEPSDVNDKKKPAKQVPSISPTRKLWLAMAGRIYSNPSLLSSSIPGNDVNLKDARSSNPQITASRGGERNLLCKS